MEATHRLAIEAGYLSHRLQASDLDVHFILSSRCLKVAFSGRPPKMSVRTIYEGDVSLWLLRPPPLDAKLLTCPIIILSRNARFLVGT
ncbi:hypothetical protein BDN71DRAFT_1448338 [Pleurotus eryngii]|uniref:Uncharacterized protein n=1 Tax=Pleurotus eryngii TaxID=5323 RepID=A0A9P5ZVR4_PLEER|nr:hypothetical protein BDN71DRAFT_1448338 [Pleurotus eryngii]